MGKTRHDSSSDEDEEKKKKVATKTKDESSSSSSSSGSDSGSGSSSSSSDSDSDSEQKKMNKLSVSGKKKVRAASSDSESESRAEKRVRDKRPTKDSPQTKKVKEEVDSDAEPARSPVRRRRSPSPDRRASPPRRRPSPRRSPHNSDRRRSPRRDEKRRSPDERDRRRASPPPRRQNRSRSRSPRRDARRHDDRRRDDRDRRPDRRRDEEVKREPQSPRRDRSPRRSPPRRGDRDRRRERPEAERDDKGNKYGLTESKKPKREMDDQPHESQLMKGKERWGKPEMWAELEKQNGPKEDEPPIEKEKVNLGTSGKLAEDTNTFKGVVIKYNEPPEAKKPNLRWRLYPFKGEEALPVLYVHRQSAYLIGRDRKIADLPVDHPSCSKQHAVLQYRSVPFEKEDGTKSRRIRPYIIDLGSGNGTFLNGERIEAQRYVELVEKDVLKFGFSSREFVVLNERSMETVSDGSGNEMGTPDSE